MHLLAAQSITQVLISMPLTQIIPGGELKFEQYYWAAKFENLKF